MTQGRWLARVARWYAAGLGLFPAEFRERYGRELEQAFLDASRDAFRRQGRMGLGRVWVSMLAEALVRIPREHVSYRRRAATVRLNMVSGRSKKRGQPMFDVVHDTRYALRSLRRQPLFAVVAIVTLGLGIGANTAIFSVVNGVVLRPLPYPEPDRLADLRVSFRGDGGERPIPASEPEYVDLRDHSEVFEAVAGYWVGNANVGGLEEPVRVPVAGVSANFLSVLGVTPSLGRGFAISEDRPGADAVVVVTHGLWQRAFAGDSTVLGRTVLVNGQPATVIGVLPMSFVFPGAEVELLRPNVIDPQNLSGRSSHYLQMVGRIRAGVAVELAQARTDALIERWRTEFPDRHNLSTRHPITVVPLHESLVGNVRTPLLVLSVAVVLVLLIACANVANLLLARTEHRHREIGIRVALGAGTPRLLRQLLTESAVLAVLGGGLGLLLGFVGVRMVSRLAIGGLPRLSNVGVDGSVLVFTFAISMVTAVLFGLGPAWGGRRTPVATLVRDGTPAATASGARMAFRRMLMVAEIGLALVLVVGSGLLIKSFQRLTSIDPGFDPSGVIAMDFSLNTARYPEAVDVARFHVELVERVEALPGVIRAGAIRSLPLSGQPGPETLTLYGEAGQSNEDANGRHWNAQYQVASPGYFAALAIPLLAGRSFTDADHAAAPPVVIVNETMAVRFWPGRDPLGQQLKVGMAEGPNPIMTVVGVVGDVLQGGLDTDRLPQLFVPRSQAGAIYGGFVTRFATFVVRTAGDPRVTMEAVRTTVRELDPTLPLANVQTMDRVVTASVADQRLLSVLMGIFSIVAIVLGAVGIYGLMTYTVTKRSHEIGVRIALGAARTRVLGSVVGQAVAVSAVGIVLGLAVALGVTRVFARLLFSVSAYDPIVFVAAPLLLFLVAALSAFWPARRASRVDPMVAIRGQ